MAYKLKALTDYMKFSFSQEVEALLKYLEPTWETNVKPKGYAAYRKNYKDFQDMEELDEEALLKSFEGHDSAGTLSSPFPVRVSLPQVAYDDVCQGRKPLETLIGAVLGHGIHIGERLAALNKMSEANTRLSYYSSAMTWFICKDDTSDEYLGMLALKEGHEYINELGTDCREIEAKYDEKRRVYLTRKLEDLPKYLASHPGPATFLNKDSSNPTTLFAPNRTFYEWLFNMYHLTSFNEKKFKKIISSLGMNIKITDSTYTVTLRKKRAKKEAL